ncbi:MAG: NUDIX domain-containing protein [Treponemataceae bacterium]|nr:NUDIX domain-containing protein [Treponemataceae bacterium]
MSRSVACIAYSEGRLLVARRKDGGDMGGRWEFPGGKLESGDDDRAAVAREMQEEFGVAAEPVEQIASCTFEHDGRTCAVTAYFVRLAHDGTAVPYVLAEHTEYKWIPPQDVASLHFVDSDLKLYPAVLSYLEHIK